MKSSRNAFGYVLYLLALCLAANTVAAETIATGLLPDDTVVRVDYGSTADSPDGGSWNTAYPNIEDAIEANKTVENLNIVIAARAVVTLEEEINVSGYQGLRLALYAGFTGAEETFTEVLADEDNQYPAHMLVFDGQNRTRIMNADFAGEKPGRLIKLFGTHFRGGNVTGLQAGGALTVKNAALSVAHTKWELSQAHVGAAIFADSLSVDGVSMFYDNIAGWNGGAFVVRKINVMAPLVFSGNQAAVGGSAFWCKESFVIQGEGRIEGAIALNEQMKIWNQSVLLTEAMPASVSDLTTGEFPAYAFNRDGTEALPGEFGQFSYYGDAQFSYGGDASAFGGPTGYAPNGGGPAGLCS